MKKKITFQLNQVFHSKLNDMILMGTEYIRRYFNKDYETHLISSIPYEMKELVLVNTYYDFEDHYIIEHILDEYNDEGMCNSDYLQKVKDWYLGKREQKLLIRLSFHLQVSE